MKKFYEILSSAILSGICISIGCITYMKVGGIMGAILFAFGLLTVVHFGWNLYTGKSGFVYSWKDMRNLFFILFGNIIGCFLISLLMKNAQPELIEKAINIVNARLVHGLLPCCLMGIGCGFIMTVAVYFAKFKQFLPLLFGVPVFILCGFYHSIADAFYFLMLPYDFISNNLTYILQIYGMIVLGNFIGCNLVRIIKLKKYYE